MHLADVFDAFNWMDRLSNLIWQALSLHPHRGLRGRLQFTPGLWEIRVERRDDAGVVAYYGGEAERLLKRFAIPIHGRRVTGTYAIFSVPIQQANFAEYLLLRGGFRLAGNLFNPDNQRYAQRHAPGTTPPAWADRSNSRPPTRDPQ